MHPTLIGLIFWWAGLFLEAIIIVRMLFTRTFKIYSVFYLYILCVFVVSAGLYLLFAKTGNRSIYWSWYWPTQLLTLIIGYGVILDFAWKSLADYPGAERFMRVVGLGIFLTIFSLVGLHVVATRGWSIDAVMTDLEKDLRIVEALFLAATLLILSFYRINIGRNLTGIVLGMGIYVSVSLTALALFKFIGPNFESTWELLQSGSYFTALAVWTAALWSYAPISPPALAPGSGNYTELAGRTRTDLESLRDQFGGTAQP